MNHGRPNRCSTRISFWGIFNIRSAFSNLLGRPLQRCRQAHHVDRHPNGDMPFASRYGIECLISQRHVQGKVNNSALAQPTIWKSCNMAVSFMPYSGYRHLKPHFDYPRTRPQSLAFFNEAPKAFCMHIHMQRQLHLEMRSPWLPSSPGPQLRQLKHC